MNYRHVYMLIIEHAKSEEKLGIRKRGNGQYYEKHHILPKSIFPNWKKKESNLVLLTAREHFFCHQLLTKIYPCQEMFRALSIFCKFKQQDRKLTSRQYQVCRETAHKSNLLWWSNTENKERVREKCFGRSRSLESRKRMSETKKLKHYKKFWWTNGEIETWSETCPDGFHKGRKPFSKEAKEHIRRGALGNKSIKGMKHWTNGVENTCSFSCPGDGWYLGITKEYNEDLKKKLSIHNHNKNLGRYWWTDGKINKFCKECPGKNFKRGRTLI